MFQNTGVRFNAREKTSFKNDWAPVLWKTDFHSASTQKWRTLGCIFNADNTEYSMFPKFLSNFMALLSMKIWIIAPSWHAFPVSQTISPSRDGALWGGRIGRQLCHPWTCLTVPLRKGQWSVNPSVKKDVPLLSFLIYRGCIWLFFGGYSNLERSYFPSWERICSFTGHLSDSLPHMPIGTTLYVVLQIPFYLYNSNTYLLVPTLSSLFGPICTREYIFTM